VKRIYCQIDKCLSCHSCEIACAVAQSKSKELITAISEDPLPLQLIKVEYIDEKGKVNARRSIAIQCRQCEDPVCYQACIAGGIYKDKKSGKIISEPEKCVGCWSCIMVCPFGVIIQNDKDHMALRCDLCPDEEIPPCVTACPTHALVYCEAGEINKEHLEQ
jgi:carbon-monoxide dehydrogenase iron sulfur subunit